jgi:hypothetical protein
VRVDVALLRITSSGVFQWELARTNPTQAGGKTALFEYIFPSNQGLSYIN